MSQKAINRLLIRWARAGRTVVRLKGGDPLLFGRGAEEALALATAGVPYEIVPGVTSAIAVPAYAGIPVTHRAAASSLGIITGHEDPAKPASAIRWSGVAGCDTLVFLMGVGNLSTILAQLQRHGRAPSTPCAAIEWGTFPRQRTVTGTLATLSRRARAAGIKPPAVIVVGKVVKLRERLNWFETKPLFGRRVLVTRALEKAAALAEQLEALGAEVEPLPAIELQPVKPNGVFQQTVRRLPDTDWVFFTSPEGIRWLSKMLKPHRKDLRMLSGCRLGAIGPKTAAALEQAGLQVDFIPKQFSQEGMLDQLPGRLLRGTRGVIFSAAESRDALEQGLRRRGMSVKRIAVYRTAIPRRLRSHVTAVFQRPVDLVTVTSASCVDHLAQALREAGLSRLFRRLSFASIGPVTTQAVRDHGGRVAVETSTSTIEGLVGAIRRYASRGGKR